MTLKVRIWSDSFIKPYKWVFDKIVGNVNEDFIKSERQNSNILETTFAICNFLYL